VTVTDATRNADTALELAAAGFYVFPCHSSGEKVKQPMPGVFWRKQSSIDEAVIRRWWSRWPDAAIGMDLAKCGLVVIDADRHELDKDGVEAFGAIMSDHGFDPDSAPLVATPSRGNHHFFRQPPGKEFGNADSALYRERKLRDMGINVRGAGGYVVAPGTVLKDGSFYELWGSLEDIPVLPAWLAAILEKEPDEKQAERMLVQRSEITDSRVKAYVDAAIEAETTRVRSAGKGGRNNTLNEAAFSLGQLVGAGHVGEAEIFALLMNAAKDCGLGQAESRKTILSGLKAGAKDPRQIADIDRPDDGANAEAAQRLIEHHDGTVTDADTGEVIDDGTGLQEGGDWSHPGGLIEDIADWIVETSPLPNRKLALAAAISFVSLVCSRHRETPGFSGGLQLFTICTGQTGIGKDWPMKAIDRLAVEAGLKELVRSGKITTSLALEKEVEKVAAQLIVADEVGRRIFGKAGSKRAGTYETAMIDTLLELWSSSPVTFFRTTSRVTGEAAVIEGPAVSIFGVSTHRDFYSSLGRSAIDNGMINRLLIIEADRRSALRSIDGSAARTPPMHIIEAIDALKPAFGSLNGGVLAYRVPEGVKTRPVPWAQEAAKEAWSAFRDEMLALADQNEETAPFVSRAAEMALRLACVHALSRLGPDGVIMMASVEWAINVVRESVRNAVQGANEYIVASDFQEHVRRVEKIIRSKGRVPKSVIARRIGGAFDNRVLESILSSLALAGKIEDPNKGTERAGASYVWRG